LTRESLLAADPEKRPAMLEKFLREYIAGVLMLEPAQLDLQMPLNNLGLDSLMAIEIRNLIEVNLGVILSMTVLLQDPSVAELTTYLLDRMSEPSIKMAETNPVPQRELLGDPPIAEAAPLNAEAARNLLDNLDQLSDASVDRLLSELTGQ